MNIQTLSDTKQARRYGAVNCICYQFDCLLATLEKLTEVLDATKTAYQVKSFWFILKIDFV